ncbi:hypothetical protein D3C86_1223360 [compost metagenome]
MKQHILVENHFDQAVLLVKTWMINSFVWSINKFLVTEIGELHEILEVVVLTTCNRVYAGCQVQTLDQHFQQILGHTVIINQSYRFPFFTLLDALFHFFNERHGYIVIQVQFCVTRKFEGECFNGIKRKDREDICQMQTNNVIDQYKSFVIPVVPGFQDVEPGNQVGNFDQSKTRFSFEIPFHAHR